MSTRSDISHGRIRQLAGFVTCGNAEATLKHSLKSRRSCLLRESKSVPLVGRLPHVRPRSFASKNVSSNAHAWRMCDLVYTPLTTDKVQLYANAFVSGIKAVAVGKHGVKPVPSDAVNGIIDALRALDMLESGINDCMLRDKIEVSVAALPHVNTSDRDLFLQRASFLGSLFVKAEICPSEADILRYVCEQTPNAQFGRARALDGDAQCTAGNVLEYIYPRSVDILRSGSRAKSSAEKLVEFAGKLLNNDRLSLPEASELGKLLYSSQLNSYDTLPVKALIAHVMRVRHESNDEIAGLALAAAASIDERFVGTSGKTKGPSRVVAHLAEPFDGTVTWDLLTPLLGHHLFRKYGYGVVYATGASSGPKYGLNLRDLVTSLGLPFAQNADELVSLLEDANMGVAVDQTDCSSGLKSWVSIRRAIVKRPALATVEKYVDVVPNGSSLFISSAFHDSYVEKMVVAAETLAFPSYIIVARGVEGSIGLGPGSRNNASLFVGVRQADNSYKRNQVVVRSVLPSELLDALQACDSVSPLKGSATASRAASLARKWLQFGASGDSSFDVRVDVTLRAIDAAMSVILDTTFPPRAVKAP